MREIKLTKGRVALVDDDDYEWLNQWKWHAVEQKNTDYARRMTKKSDGKATSMFMHRQIMECGSLEIDHIDHNGLNNQRYNLRGVTKSQNHMNANPHGTSQYMGVHLHIVRRRYFRTKIQEWVTHEGNPKWMAKIKVNNKYIYLGRFEKEEDAAIAYNHAAIKYHGEYANLNRVF